MRFSLTLATMLRNEMTDYLQQFDVVLVEAEASFLMNFSAINLCLDYGGLFSQQWNVAVPDQVIGAREAKINGVRSTPSLEGWRAVTK